MAKNILYICRYYPPEISGGARRTFALVNELIEQGHNVTIAGPDGILGTNVISAPHPIFPAKPENYTSAKINIRDKVMNWLRINLLLPDPEIRWAKRLLNAIIQSGIKPDFIVCSGPPESLYLIGAKIKKICGGRLIADMRDPWISPPQRQILLQSPSRKWLETQIAKSVFRNFDAIIAVSNFVLDDGLSLAPIGIRSEIIGHFALDNDIEEYNFPQDKFNLVHTGSIGLSNPLTQFDKFFQEFTEIAKKRPDLKLWLAGQLSENETEALKASSIANQIEIMGAVSMDKARAMQKGADALLIISGENSHALPGKFSEYSFCNRPIVLARKGKWCNLLPHANYFEMKDLLTLKKGQIETYPKQDSKAAATKLLDLFEKLK